MIRFIKFLIQAIFWLQAFIAPVLLCSIAGFIIDISNTHNKFLAYMVFGFGIIGGIILAEFIRRKYGLDTFFSKISNSDELNKEDH
jgi:hypothetical protein